MAIYLVTGSAVAQKMRSVKGFKVDLGKGVMNADSVTFYDQVVKDHYGSVGRIIHMYGRLGSLPVYSDTMYKPNTVTVYHGTKSYTEEDLEWLDYEDNTKALESFMSRAKNAMEVQATDSQQVKKEESDIDKRIRLAREASEARRKKENL